GCGRRTARRPREPALLIRLAVGIVWLLHFLPLALFARIGSGLGGLLYFFARERRNVCLTNLARCFPQMPESERVAIAKAHFRAFGRTVLERSILWWAPREEILRLVRVVGLERILALKGQPLILLVPHFVGLDAGCTRLTCEIDMAGIYARQKHPLTDTLLLLGRTPFGHQRAIPPPDGVRPAIAPVKEGYPLSHLPHPPHPPP